MADTPVEELSALMFDGTRAFVDLGNPDNLQFAQVITLEAWIKPTAVDGLRNILAHGPAWGDLMAEVFLRINNGHYQIGAWDGNNYFADYAIPPGDVGQWVHLAGAYDGQHWILYRNGQEVARTTSVRGALQAGASWAIGAAGGGTDRFFAGRIRQVAVWRALRTPDQIQQDMRDLGAAGTDGLLGCWPLDDGAGDAVRDRSGQGITGLRVGGTWIAPRALSLNGTNSYVDLGNAPGLALTSPCTLEAWIKPAAIDGVRNIVAHGYSANPPGEVYLRLAHGQYQVGSWDGADYYAAAPIPPGDRGHWIHLAGSYDGHNWILYRNGREVNRAAAARGAVPVQAPWAIGARGGGGERYFAGLVRQVAVWNTPADPTALAARAAGTLLTGTEPGLIGYWPLDAVTGTTAAGRTPGSGAGTVQNGIWGQPYLAPQARLLEDYILGPDPQFLAQQQAAAAEYQTAQVMYAQQMAQWQLMVILNPGTPQPSSPVPPAILNAPPPFVPVPATGYRTVLTAATSNGLPLPCQITLAATAPVTLYFADGTTASVDATNTVTRATDRQGVLSFFVPAGGSLLLPLLKVRADFMSPGEQVAVAADQGLHRQLAALTGNQLLGRDESGQPVPGKAPLAAAGTDPARASAVAQVVGQVMGAVAGGSLQSAGAGTRDLAAAPAPLLPYQVPPTGPGAGHLPPDAVAAYILPADGEVVRALGTAGTPPDASGTRDIWSDISGFFTHTIPDTVTTVVNTAGQTATSTTNTVSGQVTSTIHTIADGTQQAMTAIQSGGDVVVNTVSQISQQTQNSIATLTVYIRSTSGQLAQLTLTTADDAVSFAQGVLDKIGATANSVLDFFKDLFAWDDIWNTAQVYQHVVRQLIPGLQNLIAQGAIPRVQQILRAQRSIISQALDGLQADLQGWTFQNLAQGVPGATRGLDASRDLGGANNPVAAAFAQVSAGAGVQNNWLLQQVLANLQSDFGLASAPPLAVGQLGSQLTAAVTQSGLLTDLPQAGQAFLNLIRTLAHPEDIATVSLAQFVGLLKDLVLLALDLVEVLIVAILDLINAGLGGLDAVLTHPLNIPFVTDLYKNTISKGQDLTIIGLCTLLAAVPATLIYKATHNNTPPFSADQVRALLATQVQVGGTRDLAGDGAVRGVTPTYTGLKATIGALTVYLTASDMVNDAMTFASEGQEPNVIFYGWLYNIAATLIGILSEPDWLLLENGLVDWDRLSVPDQLARASWVLNWIPLVGSVILLCPPILTNDRAQEWGKGFLTVSTLPAWACGIASASLVVDADRQAGKNIWEVTGGSGWPLLTTILASVSTVLQFLRLQALNDEDFEVPMVIKSTLTFPCDVAAGIFQGFA